MRRWRNAAHDRELEIRVDDARPEGPQDGALVLQSASLERLQLVAEALSKSVVLGHYEARIAADFERIEPLALELERRSATSPSCSGITRGWKA